MIAPDSSGQPLLLCLSHVDWDCLGERSRQLMVQATADHQVVFWEQRRAAPEARSEPFMRLRKTPEGVMVATPLVPAILKPARADAAERKLLDGALFLVGEPVAVTWYHAPGTLDGVGDVSAPVTMPPDTGAAALPPDQVPRLPASDLPVFRKPSFMLSDDRRITRPKRRPHAVSGGHGLGARRFLSAHDRSPSWQAVMPRPCIGYYGQVDERLDLALLDAVARLRPTWQFVMLGPRNGLSLAALPRRPNIHWHGPACDDDVQACLSGWDAGFLPFALTAEARSSGAPSLDDYLMAGVPVVTTLLPGAIADNRRDLVLQRRQPEGVVAALQELITMDRPVPRHPPLGTSLAASGLGLT